MSRDGANRGLSRSVSVEDSGRRHASTQGFNVPDRADRRGRSTRLRTLLVGVGGRVHADQSAPSRAAGIARTGLLTLEDDQRPWLVPRSERSPPRDRSRGRMDDEGGLCRPATNDGSSFSDHLVLVWTTGGHTYALGFHLGRSRHRTQSSTRPWPVPCPWYPVNIALPRDSVRLRTENDPRGSRGIVIRRERRSRRSRWTNRSPQVQRRPNASYPQE